MNTDFGKIKKKRERGLFDLFNNVAGQTRITIYFNLSAYQ